MIAVHEVVPLRQCTQTLSASPRKSACVLFEMGRCGAPCIGEQTTQEYADVAGLAATALIGDGRDLIAALRAKLDTLAEHERFEDATTLRDRMLALIRATSRAQRLAPLSSAPEIVAARRRESGGWEVVCVRYGRLAGTTVTPRGADPMPFIEAVRATAEVVLEPSAPAPAAHPEEAELVLKWLEAPGTRLVTMEGQWTCPVGGAGAARAELEPMSRRWNDFAEPWGEATSVKPLERPPGALRPAH